MTTITVRTPKGSFTLSGRLAHEPYVQALTAPGRGGVRHPMSGPAEKFILTLDAPIPADVTAVTGEHESVEIEVDGEVTRLVRRAEVRAWPHPFPHVVAQGWPA